MSARDRLTSVKYAVNASTTASTATSTLEKTSARGFGVVGLGSRYPLVNCGGGCLFCSCAGATAARARRTAEARHRAPFAVCRWRLAAGRHLAVPSSGGACEVERSETEQGVGFLCATPRSSGACARELSSGGRDCAPPAVGRWRLAAGMQLAVPSSGGACEVERSETEQGVGFLCATPRSSGACARELSSGGRDCAPPAVGRWRLAAGRHLAVPSSGGACEAERSEAELGVWFSGAPLSTRLRRGTAFAVVSPPR
jgi:hypothetical protein